MTNYVTTTSDLSGDVIVEKGMTEGVLIRKVKSGFLHTSGRQTDTPATLIFIWSYTTNTGETKNPALITIHQIDASERQVEDFADLFISGLHFQK